MEQRKRNKSVVNFQQEKTQKFYKDNINLLLNKIKVEKCMKEDITFIIILFFSKKNFKKLNPEYIIKSISNPQLFPSLTGLINLKVDIKNELKNTELFEVKKNKVKLLYEKCLNYLRSNYEKNTVTKSSDSTKTNHANFLDFAHFESEVEYGSTENEINMNLVIEKNNINNSFDFGKRNKIKMNKKKKPNLNSLPAEDAKDVNNTVDIEELNDKIISPQYEITFDENKNFQNIMKAASEFFIHYKISNNDESTTQSLDERIKKLNKLFLELNAEIEPFNKLSACLNELKNELLNCNNIIKRQMMLIKFIHKNIDTFSMDIYEGEKEMFFSYQDVREKMFTELQNYYAEVKNTENFINSGAFLLKNELNSIADELKLTEKDDKFYNLIKEINSTESLPINVNMGDILKLLSAYFVEYDKPFTHIEESKKSPEK